MQYFKYRESKTHGTFGFPIEIYHIDDSHPRYEMSHHWHKEFELIRIKEGTFTYTLDGIKDTATAGDILFINGGVMHAGTPDKCQYECIVFDLDMLLKQGDACYSILHKFSSHQLLADAKIPVTAMNCKSLCDTLFDAMTQNKQGYQLVTQGLLYQLFGEILEKGLFSESIPDHGGAQRKIRQLKQALKIIENEYSSPLTLDRLAEAADMSPKYFCRFFYSMTQFTPIDYLNHHRIEVACFQLEMTNNTITNIAYECGFNDLSYFIRVFKKYKGIPPKRYGRQMLGKE